MCGPCPRTGVVCGGVWSRGGSVRVSRSSCTTRKSSALCGGWGRLDGWGATELPFTGTNYLRIRKVQVPLEDKRFEGHHEVQEEKTAAQIPSPHQQQQRQNQPQPHIAGSSSAPIVAAAAAVAGKLARAAAPACIVTTSKPCGLLAARLSSAVSAECVTMRATGGAATGAVAVCG